MNHPTNIIKHGGNRPSEPFSRDKLHTSIVTTCLSARAPEGQAKTTADTVCDAVVTWLEQKPEVTSHDIRTVAARSLKNYHPEAAYLYEQHKITI
jgi:transcriptional regulator NrdR family protein